MATAAKKSSCCNTGCKRNPTMTCLGCRDLLYCARHYREHRDDLSNQLQMLTDKCNQIREDIQTRAENPQVHTLMKTIDEWETRSIAKIRQMAEATRTELLRNNNKDISQVKVKLENLCIKLLQNPDDYGFVDTDIENWTDELERLKSMLNKTFDFTIREDPTKFISKIRLEVNDTSNIPLNAQWTQIAVIIAGGNGEGNSNNQLNYPNGLYVDDETLVIADTANHRIVQWNNGDTNGHVVAGGNGQGNRLDQLYYPADVLINKETDSLIISDSANYRVVRWSCRSGTRQGEILIDNIDARGLAMDDQGYLYVSNSREHEVRRYRPGNQNGTLAAGGNGGGNGLNQLYYPTCLFVDRQQNVYVSDCYNNRVMKWNKGAKQGIIVIDNQIARNYISNLNQPNGIFVDTLGTLYIADSLNHRIIRWFPDDKQGTVIAGVHGKGPRVSQFSRPHGLSFDRHGNLYVVDSQNHRVQRFSLHLTI